MASLASIIPINGLGRNLQYLREKNKIQALGQEALRLNSFRGLIRNGILELTIAKMLKNLGGLHHAKNKLLAFSLLALRMIRQFEAKIPHDKVYAIFGVLHHLGLQQHGIALKSKYELSVEDGYLDATFFLIQNFP